jgi:hypothetical protein
MISPGDWPCLDTTWAKRLRVSRSRQLFYLIARAV